MLQNLYKYSQNTYLFAFLGCIAVLPMSDTIALRNIFLVLMLLLLISANVFSKNIRFETISAAKLMPLPLILWMIYLCMFPIWAPRQDVAWENFFGQWGESIIAWIVGFGAFIILPKRGPSLFAIGLASAFPLIVHLLLSTLAFMGFLSENFYRQRSLTGLYDEMTAWSHGDFTLMNFHNPLVEGFNGIEVMHGNLGYASTLAIIIFTTTWYSAFKKNKLNLSAISAVAIICCFVSLFIIRSRGAILFGFLFLIITLMLNLYKNKSGQVAKPNGVTMKAFHRKLRVLVLLGIATLLAIGYKSVESDYRWHSMVDKIIAAVQIEDPLETLCNGLSVTDEIRIRNSIKGESQEYIDDVIFGLKRQDGGRILLMRVGIDFVLENPFGLDGSRQSYKQLIMDKCGHIPLLTFAHTHQSWMDLSLALGWAGAILFALIFLNFLAFGVQELGDSENIDLLIVLIAMSLFWLVRGLFDSLYREHYLEMQAIILSYLYLRYLRLQQAER